ncbi:hypothetical protein F2Q70_00000952 [Brassica cretica]|uniref:Cyclin C-terminal domain-containing protein n=1 Tax=Brassica cretica TaxID=69181 RepID=A0A8S9J2L7_BRACR|nr:hypothetical protein F2Q70_00000952 [Brassica cretica]
MLAASAVYTARCSLNKSPAWTETLKFHTGYAESEIIRACSCGRRPSLPELISYLAVPWKTMFRYAFPLHCNTTSSMLPTFWHQVSAGSTCEPANISGGSSCTEATSSDLCHAFSVPLPICPTVHFYYSGELSFSTVHVSSHLTSGPLSPSQASSLDLSDTFTNGLMSLR